MVLIKLEGRVQYRIFVKHAQMNFMKKHTDRNIIQQDLLVKINHKHCGGVFFLVDECVSLGMIVAGEICLSKR